MGEDRAAPARGNAAPMKGIAWSQLRLPRDGILFLVGLLGVWHETVVVTHIRVEALVFFGAMLGLVPPLRYDDRRHDAEDG